MLTKFTSPKINKLLKELNELIYSNTMHITNFQMQEQNGNESVSNEIIGGGDEYLTFTSDVKIPPHMHGEKVVFFIQTEHDISWRSTNPQFAVFVNGERKQGLDVNHKNFVLTETAEQGEVFSVKFVSYQGPGLHGNRSKFTCHIKTMHQNIYKYYYDILVPYRTAFCLDKQSLDYINIMKALNDSLNILDLRVPYSEEFFESLMHAQNYITANFYQKHCGETQAKIYCVGHTHIDIAWKWTLQVTKDKVLRSFSTVVSLMEQFPDYKFMSSQPQLYVYVKEQDPILYAKIKQLIAQGRWEVEGGMFVEADCNISSGEALVRQFVYGKKFFKNEFGKDNKILWLPDVFGYSSALPQIMKKCGIDYFMTTKISWNETNRLPYDTFYWQGMDGTNVLVHFSPGKDLLERQDEMSFKTEHYTTYNGLLNPEHVIGSWQRYEPKSLNDEALLCFGYGDGGGGPTAEMLENYERLKYGMPGAPTPVMSFALEFFEKLEESIQDKPYVPKWVGELYLEYHRGTYTSMARNKKYNRKAEFLLLNQEFFASLNTVLLNVNYPKESIDEQWIVLLRNQFHDILPGSSIKEVYEDSDIEYKYIFDTSNLQIEKALDNIVNNIDAKANELIVFNANGTTCQESVIEFESDLTVTQAMCGERVYPLQKTSDNTYVFVADNLPIKGYTTYELANGDILQNSFSSNDKCLENTMIKICFDECGRICSMYMKNEQREVLKAGTLGNVLMTYEDKPYNYDAWDINSYYKEKSWEITDVRQMSIVEQGPVRTVLLIERVYLSSTIKQYFTLYSNDTNLIVYSEIDWKESHILLKAHFDFDVHTDSAQYEIQYGNVTRPTHANTSWDEAKFEVCMHKWLDLSEDDFGISVLNDCKYGVSVLGTNVGVSLIKSAKFPNPDADKELHSFTYAIYPHVGTWKTANTIQRAYALNNAPYAKIKQNEGGTLAKSFSAVHVMDNNIIAEVLKKAEDENGIILRLYETDNKRTNTLLQLQLNIKEVFLCDMLENNIENLVHNLNCLNLQFKPYEIKTIKIVLQD